MLFARRTWMTFRQKLRGLLFLFLRNVRQTSFCRRLVQILIGLMVVQTSLFAVLVGPPAQAPNPDFFRTLWVGGTQSILKIDAAQGTLIFEIPTSDQIRAIGIDEQRGIVWAHGGAHLLGYAFDGNLVHQVFLSGVDPPEDEGESKPGEDLVVNSSSGDVWLGVGKKLRQFDETGQLLETLSFSQPILALALDPVPSLLWVATRKAIDAVDETAQVVATLSLGNNPGVSDLEVDPPSGHLWIALKKSLLRYDPVADSSFEEMIKGIESLAATVDSGAWAATKKELLRLDQLGQTLFESDSFTQTIVALVADPSDLSGWAARQKHLTHISSEGQILHELEFHGQDAVLNLTGRIWDLALYADVIGPEISIQAPENGSLINDNRPEIQILYGAVGIGVDPGSLVLTADAQTLSVSCNFEADSAICTPDSPLSEGEIVLTAQVQDYVGNLSNTAQTTFTVDTVAPSLSITAPQQDAYLSSNQPSIELTYSDSGSGVDTDTLTLQLSGSELPATCSFGTSAADCTPDSVLEDGPATVTATIQDQAGNTSSPAQVSFVVDTIAPTLGITTPAEGSAINSGTPEIGLTYDDGGSGLDFSTLILTANGNALDVNCNLSDTGTCTPTSPLPEGTVVLGASIQDLAGNESQPAQVTFVVDLTPPVIVVTSPIDGSTVADPRQQFIGQVSEPSDLTVNADPISVTGSGVFSHGPTTLDPGLNVFEFEAVDPAGNIGTLTVQVTLNRPPVITSTPVTEVNSGTPYGYLVQATDPDAGDVLTFSVVGPADINIDPNTGQLTWNPGGLDVGDHAVTVRVEDQAGLLDTQSFSLSVLGNPPAIVSSPETSANVEQPYTYDVEATDPDPGDQLTFSLETAPSGMTIEPDTGLIQWTPENCQGGEHTVTLRVEDGGGLFDTQTYSLLAAQVCTEAPPNLVGWWPGEGDASDIGNQNDGQLLNGTTFEPGKVGQGFSFDGIEDAVRIPDPGGSRDLDGFSELTIDAWIQTLSIDPSGTIVSKYDSRQSSGVSYHLSVGIRDGIPGRLQIVVSNRPNSALFFTRNQVVFPNTLTHVAGVWKGGLDYELYVDGDRIPDTEVDLLIFGTGSSTMSNNNVPVNIGRFESSSGSSSAPFGHFPGLIDEVEIFNRALTAQEIAAIYCAGSAGKCIPDNLSPRLTTTPPTTATQGEPYEYEAQATDPDTGDVLTFSLPEAPVGMTIDPATGRLEWTPTSAQTGDQTVTLRVEDRGGLFDSQTFVVQVADTPDPPSITSTELTSAIQDQTYNYDVEATDPDPGEVLVYSLDVLPAGMEIDSSTGLIQWTPASSQLGDHAVSVRVVDSTGLSGTQTYTVTVANINDPPLIISGPRLLAVLEQLYTYDADASDPDPGDVLSYSLDTSPLGMAIDGVTGLIQWTPNPLQLGDHLVIVRVQDAEGLFDTQSYTLTVGRAVAGVNEAPEFVSSPGTDATQGEPYAYQAVATDPNPDDILRYFLESGPDGMTIDAVTGEVQWTPGDQLGPTAVELRVEDLGGLFDVQTFTVCVTAAVCSGSIFLTGHDADFHAVSGNTEGARNINRTAINFIRHPAVNPFVGVATAGFLFVESNISPAPDGHRFGKRGIKASGFDEGVDFEHHDASTLDSELDLLGTKYDAIVVASDDGGLLTEAELVILNARSEDILTFINAGGGIYALVENGSLTQQATKFGYLPFILSTTAFGRRGAGVQLTDFGRSLGLTTDDVNGNFDHQLFDDSFGLHVVDLNRDGRILSLAGRGPVNSSGICVQELVPPTITTTPNTAATEGQLYAYDVDAIVDNSLCNVLTFVLEGAPVGMSIDVNTGLIQWTPKSFEAGSYPVTVRVHDIDGISTSQSFTLTVDNLNHPPSFTSAPGTSAVQGQIYGYHPAVTDADLTPAFSFDGDGDAVAFGDSLDSVFAGPDEQFSFDFWANIGEPHVGTLVSKIGDTSGAENERQFQVLVRSDGSLDVGIHFARGPQSRNRSFRAATRLEVGVWYHIGIVYDGSLDTNDGQDRVKIYLDGADSTTFRGGTGDLGEIKDGSASLALGAAVASDLSSVLTGFRGRIDEFEIFDRVLTESEVRQIFEAGGAGKCKPSRLPGCVVPPSGLETWWTADGHAEDATENVSGFFMGNANAHAVGRVGELFTFSLDQAPAGMDVDPASGRIEWTPGGSDAGNHDVILRVVDSGGLSDTQAFTLRVDATVAVPGVVGLAQADAEAVIQTAGLVVGTVSEANSTSVPVGDVISQSPVTGTIVVEGSPVDLVVSLGPAIISVPDVVGLLQADAEAALTAAGLVVGTISTRHSALAEGGVLSQDPAAGTDVLEGSTVNLLVSLGPVPGDSTPPVVSISSPDEDAELISPTDVVGTVDDENLFQYVLSLSRISESGQRVLASGSSPVLNAVLGQIDSTLLENGMYRLRLSAQDLNGRTASVERVIRVDGHAKLGILRLSFVDLQIPVAGIPILVTRTYDSRVKAKRDFGIGWSLDIARGFYENNRTPGEGWQILAGSPPFGLPCEVVNETLSHLTEVRLSDREFYLFRTTLSITGSSAGGCFANAGFEFVDGVRPDAVLQVLGNNQVFYQNGFNRVLNAGDLTPYDPDQVRLTTADGRIFDLDRTDGTFRIEDRNGNSISIASSGVTHSTGKSIAFTRDGSGRITAITDPLNESLTYQYDAAGDLVGVTDRSQNQTLFSYDTDHLLIDITDPLGNRPLRNEYDADGRLVAHVDAAGNRSQLDFDLTNGTTTVTDRLDQASTLTYDEEGNVTSAASSTGSTFSFTYDARGNKTSQTDPLNHTRTFTYDSADRLLSEKDDLDNTLSYTYRADGLLTSMTDEEGGKTSLDYDADGNLLTLKDVNDEVLNQFTYNAAGNPTQATTLGGTTEFTYDGFGNLTRQLGPESQDVSYTYDANGRRTSSTRRRTTASGLVDETTGFTYDASGRLLTVTDPLGNVTTHDYDASGRLTSIEDPEGNTTTFTYSLRGKVSRIDFPDGTFERFGYDLENRLASRTDRASRITVYEYNDLEQVERILHPDGSNVRYNFDAAGRLVGVVDGRGRTTTYTYDTADRLTNRADPLGNAWSFTPNSIGAATTQTDPLGNVAQFTYDSSLFRAPRRLSTTFDDGSSQARTFGSSGRIASQTDEEGNTTTFDYAADGNLIQVTDALGGETTYTYDEVGNRISQRDANGNTTSFEYDANGNRLKTTLPSGLSASMSYDRAGNLLSRTDFNGDIITYAYDSMNRRVSQSLPDASTISWTYTATGQVETVTDPRGVTTYSYDAIDRIVGIDPPDGSSLVYSYDAAGNRTSVESPAGTTQYSYDAANRLSSVTDPDLRVSSYTYDVVGNLVQITHANGTQTHRAYDSRNRLITVEHAGTGGAPTLAGFSYELDGRSNRKRMTESPSGRVVDYTYDALSRLTQEQTGAAITTYAYDAVGNRISRNGEVLSYDVDDRLLTAGTTSFTYDNNGNRLTRTVGTDLTQYVYDGRNMLTEQTAADGTLTTYAYDATGNRVRRATGSAETHFLVDPLDASGVPQVVVETDELGAIRSSYVYGHDLLSATLEGSDRYYHSDGLGSTRALTDAGGSVTDSYEYDAFGNPTALSGSSPNTYLFAGEQLDPGLGLGLYYLRARYMDPAQGRFTTRDPFEGLIFDPATLNKYAYAHNNPVNRTDPTGLFSLTELSIAVAISASLSTGSDLPLTLTKFAQETTGKINQVISEFESLNTLKLNESAARAELGTEWAAVIRALLSGENQVDSAVRIRDAVRDPGKVKLGKGAVDFAYKVSAALAGKGMFKKVIMALWRGNAGLWMRILPEGEEVRLPAGYLDCGYNDYVSATFGLQVIQDGFDHFKLDIGKFSGFFEGLGITSAYTNFLVLVAETGGDLMLNTQPPIPPGGRCVR